MLDVEVLVREGSAIYGLASSAVMVGEVSSLCHEISNDAMEMGAFVSETLFMSAKSPKVGCGLRGFFVEQFEHHFGGQVVSKIKLEENSFECHSHFNNAIKSD